MELKELLKDSILKKHAHYMAAIFEDHYSVDIATAIEDFEDEELLDFLALLSNEQIALITEEASATLQKRILDLLEVSKVIEIFSFMSTDDIADIIGVLSFDKRKDLLKRMKSGDSHEIQTLLNYGEDTAGGIMTTQYIALKSELTVQAALNKIRVIGPKTEVIETIFVLNNFNELVGVVDLRDILTANEETYLYELMNENVIYVHPDTDQEEVSLIVSKYDLKAIPVVNSKQTIIGIVTVDDIIDVIVEEHTEDMLRMSGVNKDERVGSKVSDSIKRRLPWLFVNLCTAFLASFTVGLFENVISQVVALAAAMPIVAGLGGNAGSQTLSITIRSIALGEINIRDDWKTVFKEVSIGFINGLSVGLITAGIIYLRYTNLYLSMIILIAMICNMMIAGLLGFMIPLIMKKLKFDPAISSSIFLTATTDTCGFFIFLGLASIVLPHLI